MYKRWFIQLEMLLTELLDTLASSSMDTSDTRQFIHFTDPEDDIDLWRCTISFISYISVASISLLHRRKPTANLFLKDILRKQIHFDSFERRISSFCQLWRNAVCYTSSMGFRPKMWWNDYFILIANIICRLDSIILTIWLSTLMSWKKPKNGSLWYVRTKRFRHLWQDIAIVFCWRLRRDWNSRFERWVCRIRWRWRRNFNWTTNTSATLNIRSVWAALSTWMPHVGNEVSIASVILISSI